MGGQTDRTYMTYGTYTSTTYMSYRSYKSYADAESTDGPPAKTPIHRHAPSRPPSFSKALNHLFCQLRSDAAFFVLEVNKCFLPLTLLCLGEFCPAVDIGRLVIFAS